ncbi:tetraacyldisaccharide 4'-kinase [bacterium]|nr:tetraacyldisaccharide 4'-kinase [bacterium]
MNEQQFLKLIAGQPIPGGRLLRFLLRVVSWPYAAVMTVRNRLFDWGLRRVHSPTVPVISVGNLTTGGTGKTPVVARVVQQLQQAGLKPGIVSRGYRSLDDAGNDERRVLDVLCPGVPHVQNRDRAAAVEIAVAEHGCNVIVADDAFQHRRLGRTLDIVLIDATNPWGYGAILPRGLLREPRSGLRRADLIAVTRADLVEPASLDAIWRDIRRFSPDAPRVEIAFQPTGLRSLLIHAASEHVTGVVHPTATQSADDEPASDASASRPRRAVVFSGIGNPDAFRATVETLGLDVAAFRAFPDHWHYSETDLTELAALATEHSADLLLTTLKDLVKLRDLPQPATEIAAVEIVAVATVGDAVFRAAITQRVIEQSVGNVR